MPIPKPRKRKGKKSNQITLAFQDNDLSTDKQGYEVNEIIMAIREIVGRWRMILDPSKWNVTPQTERLLLHWRRKDWPGRRPFFCQVEAVETIIWLTEVAPATSTGKRLLE